MTRAIVNTYDQLVAGLPCVGILERKGPLSKRATQWAVYDPTRKTDPTPGGPWYDNGCKTFSFFLLGGRRAALVAAKAWAAEKYGVTRWKRNALRDYVPADVFARFPLRGGGE